MRGEANLPQVVLPGVIMAAGSSSRMGRPKQLLRFGDVTMLEHVLLTVAESTLEPIVVVLGAHADDIRAEVNLHGARSVFNANHSRGSATSLRAGLAAVDPSAGAAVVAGDQPAITADLIDALAAGYRREDAWAAVVEYTDGVGHPWVLSYRALEAMPSFEGDKLLWHMLSEDDRVLRVGVDRPKPRDVNTWDDYEAACRDLGYTPTAG